MTIDDIIEHVVALGGVLLLQPRPGDGTPEISWGDTFFYYAPDGVVPSSQPFATIITKDYPGDDTSRLDPAERFRLNISASRDRFRAVTGQDPRDPAPSGVDANTADVLIRHPVYGDLGWLAVVNPGGRTAAEARDLLSSAHHAARDRYQRRAETAGR